MCQSHDWGNQVGLEGLFGSPQSERLDQGLHVRREHVIMEATFYSIVGTPYSTPESIHISIHTCTCTCTQCTSPLYIHITKSCKLSLRVFACYLSVIMPILRKLLLFRTKVIAHVGDKATWENQWDKQALVHGTTE